VAVAVVVMTRGAIMEDAERRQGDPALVLAVFHFHVEHSHRLWDFGNHRKL
jgi:hypothetical protein